MREKEETNIIEDPAGFIQERGAVIVNGIKRSLGSRVAFHHALGKSRLFSQSEAKHIFETREEALAAIKNIEHGHELDLFELREGRSYIKGKKLFVHGGKHGAGDGYHGSEWTG